MKRIIKTFITLAILLFLVNTSWYSYIFKGIYATYLQGNTTANIFDGTSFKKGKISAQNPTPWPVKIDSRFTPSLELSQALSTIETGAFLIFDNDTLRHEQYNNKVSQESKTNSFSILAPRAQLSSLTFSSQNLLIMTATTSSQWVMSVAG